MLRPAVIAFLISLALIPPAAADDASMQRWLDRFKFEPPAVEHSGVCTGRIGELPSFSLAAARPGPYIVRVSLPFAPGAFPAGMGVAVVASNADGAIETTPSADLRVLTYHPGQPRSVRRAIVTFPFEFPDQNAREFNLELVDFPPPAPGIPAKQAENTHLISAGRVEVAVQPDRVDIAVRDGAKWSATLIAPPRSATGAYFEVIESGMHFVWVRLLEPDTNWARIIDIQANALGTVAVRAHIQRLESGDGTAPDLGWMITGPAGIEFPTMAYEKRGKLISEDGKLTYYRCTADEKVPMQEAAWRQAGFVTGNEGRAPYTALYEPPLRVRIDARHFDAVYGSGVPDTLALWPVLDELRSFTQDAIADAMATGDDFGNVTAFNPAGPAPAFGMNRLNHCPAIFREYWRSAGHELRETALLWCGNMYDLSLWWGDDKTAGGTRYNNVAVRNGNEHENDASFMWRSNDAVHFCTKGFESFFYAYEETGDPRMPAALRAQVAYSRQFVHADQGECRNIGDVADFIALYRATGLATYRDEALRLFRELRLKLSPKDLFSQGGQPIVEDGPFIDDDEHGYKAPFAKPYIIGYALAGLPDLLEEFPGELKLRDVVRAVADFLAESQDPAGGWRYPHPSSSRTLIEQALEHAAQVAAAAKILEARGENISGLLDAIETALQARVLGYARTGGVLSGLTGWEFSPGNLKEGQTLYDLYRKPADRDPARDYTEGAVSVGGSCPEGLVYFSEVLAFYLAHRPAERLFHPNTRLRAVLERTPDNRLKLEPLERGSYLRVTRPDDDTVGFVLWAPEWVSVPKLGYGKEELGGMALDWRRDPATGAAGYTIDRPDAVFTAHFTPYLDYVACAYTVWPKPGTNIPARFAVGPCQQMKMPAFDGDEADLLDRLFFHNAGAWIRVGSCAGGNPRNVIFLQGRESPDMTGDMAAGGWRTIHHPRPDIPVLACVSRDGTWLAATAAEHSGSLCNNAGASHRCMHSQGDMPLCKDGPTTLRVNAYLFRGTLDDLKQKYDRDAARWNAVPSAPAAGTPLPYGIRALLPAFRDMRIAQMTFPLAWQAPQPAALPPATDCPPSTDDYSSWRAAAREAYLRSLGPRPPLVPFAVEEIAQEDRGRYVAKKIALNLSAYARVTAYLLVPKGTGPFPAVIALHDHGAHFSIGKEKVVRPLDESDARIKDALKWVEACYGNQFFGDALAERGYVVFSIDALFWGDRGPYEGPEYEAQQALAANLIQLGYTWAGLIVWDDVRSAEFVQGLPETAPERIACMGLSMGGHRAWSLCAATDIVKAGAAICWMDDSADLTGENNNQTRGQSAYSMIVPGLRNLLDYPDVAALACPKPMLFYNGKKDGLFAVDGVTRCYEKMRRVWESQNAGDKLVTKLWDVPHEFNRDMQADAFAWLDQTI